MPAMQLRPLSFGEILDGAFALYRRHFLALFLTGLIPLLPTTLLSWMVMPNPGAYDPETAGAESLVWVIPVLLLSSLVMVLVVAALTWQTGQAIIGNDVSIGDGLRHGLRALLPLVAAVILAYVLLMVAMLVTIFGVGLLAAVVIPSGNSVVRAIIAVVAVLLAMAFSLAVIAMLFAVVPAVVIERKGPWAALQRSRRLSKGARMRIVGVFFVSMLIVTLPTMGVMIAAGTGTAMFDPAAAATLSTPQLVFQQIVGLLGYALAFPLFVGCMLLLYYDRRVRTEAYDLELAAEGLAPAD